MAPIMSIMDSVMEFSKSTQDFFLNGIVTRQHISSCHYQIDVLKRLLREAFSDVMKVRDRQEKIEQMISFYKSSKASPFEDGSTHLRGDIDALRALLMLDLSDQHKHDLLNRSGLRIGVSSRFTFETGVRQNDRFVAELIASEKIERNCEGIPLSLAKVLYVANVSESLSAVAIPLGAQCRDVGMPTHYSHQGNGFSDCLSFGPPLLNRRMGSALALVFSGSNIVASVSQFVSTLPAMHLGSQLSFPLSTKTKLSFLGLHPFPNPVEAPHSLHPGIVKPPDASSLSGSMAVAVESQLDESTRCGGWVEMGKSNTGSFCWAVGLSDAPEGETGWGVSLGGANESLMKWDRIQMEGFARIKFGKKFKLQPGFFYVMDRNNRLPALMCRFNWSL